MNTTEREGRTLRQTGLPDRDLIYPICRYVRAYVLRHGRNRTAKDFGISRHTLWRFLERGHVGCALPRADFNDVGESVEALEAARQELMIDLVSLPLDVRPTSRSDSRPSLPSHGA